MSANGRHRKGSDSSRSASQFRDAELLTNSAAGILFSGDSGTGKSNALMLFLQKIISARYGMTLLDPHGDLADDVEIYLASQPESVRRRAIVLRPSDTTRVTGLNPIAVDRTGLDDITYRARLASRVGHVSKILLHAFGERDFNGKPVLAKWTNRILTILATTGLTLADACYFFDVNSPIYQALTAAAPDFVSQIEMAQLADLRPADREDQIGSTKNRLLNFLSNPIVRLMLGMPSGHLDFNKAIRDRSIIIISLARGGALRDEDVEIFANLWLMEVLYAIYNTPRGQRVPHFLVLDELPTFRASFEIITNALAQVRKFLCRFVVAFQGTQLFEERQNDRLLNALIGQCDVHFYFRHKNPVDAKFFGEIIKLPSIDTKKVKHEQRQEQQYQDGHELVTLFDSSENLSAANQDGSSVSDGTTNTDTTSTGTTETTGTSTGESTSFVANAVEQARNEQSGKSNQSGNTSGHSSAQGTTQTSGKNWSKTMTRGMSVTRKQSLVPIIRTREIVTSVQFYSTEEQFLEAARDIALLPCGTCFLYVAAKGVSRVVLPLARNPLGGLPKYSAKMLGQLRKLVFSRPEFSTPDELLRLRQEFEARLIDYLSETNRSSQALLTDARTVLILPENCDNPILHI